MKPLYSLALLAAMLEGCAVTRPLVSTVPTVEVPSMPIVEKCVKPEDVPPIPTTNMVKGSTNIESNAAAASADIRELSQYASIADAILKKCSQ